MMGKRVVDLPAGRLLLTVQDGKLCRVSIPRTDETYHDCDPVLNEAQRQLEAYFAGESKTFDLPLSMDGTPFECTVWRQLLQIPFGRIRTYGQIAAQLGMPKAARAVGGACSRNPLLIVIPCHRVIAGSGRLTGFAAGMQMKRELLSLEGWGVQDDQIDLNT